MKRLAFTLAVIIIILCGLYFKFFTIHGVTPEKKMDEYPSPGGKYTVTVYLNNGGATTGFAVLCTVRKADKTKEKNIYWNYRCEKADVIWLDEETVSINGTALNVTQDTFDFRKDTT